MALLAQAMTAFASQQQHQQPLAIALSRLSPLAHLEKESVETFLRGEYLNLLRLQLATANRKRVREAGVAKPKQIKLGSITLTEELSLDPDGPSRRESLAALSMEGWTHL
jgi:hypothetical protein